MDENKRLISIDSYVNKSTEGAPSKKSRFKSILTYILIIIVLVIVAFSYSFFTSTSFIIIDTNASINLKVNRWNKVIDASALDNNGSNILNSAKVKYKNVNDALTLILSTAEEENYVNSLSKDNTKKQVSVFVSGNDVSLNSFSSIAKARNFNLAVNENGQN